MITKMFLKDGKVGLLSRSVILLFLVACITGCSSPGAMLQESAVKQVKEGMSREEVLRIMGQPKKMVKGPDGEQADQYVVFLQQPTFTDKSNLNGTLMLKTLQVFYDPSGKVEFVENYEAPIPYWKLLDGVARAGIKGGIAAIPKIEKEMTNLYELTEKLGEPMGVYRSLDGLKSYSWFVFEASKANNHLEMKAELRVVLDRNMYIIDYRIFEE